MQYTRAGSKGYAGSNRVVVKFRDEVILPYEDGVEAHPLLADFWKDLTDVFGTLRLVRVFRSVSPGELEAFSARMPKRGVNNISRVLLTYHAIECPSRTGAASLVRTLRGWKHVELAYVEPSFVTPPQGKVKIAHSSPSPEGGNNPLRSQEGFLLPAAMGGIDAQYAATMRGTVAGTGVGIADVERSWFLQHPDLPPLATDPSKDGDITEGGVAPDEDCSHGASVVGILAMRDDDLGGIGIVPGVTVHTISIFRSADDDHPATYVSLPDAIMTAITVLQKGDVLVIPLQSAADGDIPANGPVELAPAVFHAIQAATSQGRIVVEAAGNGEGEGNGGDGALNLDDYPAIQRTGSTDSGAIIVSAADPTSRVRSPGASHGKRVDCYAWGSGILTASTPTDPNAYNSNFGGTSGASAIVAGAAVAVQWMAAARQSAAVIRAWLSDSDPKTGNTPPAGSDKIGMMPNLKGIAQRYLASPPASPLKPSSRDRKAGKPRSPSRHHSS